ncbi:uncharacterized protein LOC112501783 [Cynara cardunculus var. scolymus]|uniref:uncharacterized protein LOC112501783 n=1 Tax=Cynara cardunculus var. scolymus TaxID=59895 RepID=UPI000D629E48|nr:uncharacterized protein LOC112501783 [Cynara cardunculus var. scolymus]
MEIVTAIVSPLVESLMVPVKKHLGYLISYKKYVRDMGTRMRDLKATRLGVEDHINHNKSNCLMVPMEVSGWLEEVGNIEAQALPRTIEFEEELAEKFGGSSSSSSSRNVTTDFEETDKAESNNQTVLDIRKKYEKKLAAHQGNQDDVSDDDYFIKLFSLDEEPNSAKFIQGAI